jgi:hypothetical protein
MGLRHIGERVAGEAFIKESHMKPDFENISRKGPRNCRSLGFARDDKKERLAARKGRLLRKRPPNNLPGFSQAPCPLATVLSLQHPLHFVIPSGGMACGPPMRMKMFRFSNLSARTHHSFLFVIPSGPGFPTSPLSPTTTYVVLLKENHMQVTEAATLDRKSGGAEGSAVRLSMAPPF